MWPSRQHWAINASIPHYCLSWLEVAVYWELGGRTLPTSVIHLKLPTSSHTTVTVRFGPVECLTLAGQCSAPTFWTLVVGTPTGAAEYQSSLSEEIWNTVQRYFQALLKGRAIGGHNFLCRLEEKCFLFPRPRLAFAFKAEKRKQKYPLECRGITFLFISPARSLSCAVGKEMSLKDGFLHKLSQLLFVFKMEIIFPETLPVRKWVLISEAK